MSYRTHVFDVDGTLLRSNAVKSRAFWLAASRFGVAAANAAMKLHQTAGSISRRERWERIFTEILHLEPSGDLYDAVRADCDRRIVGGLTGAEVVPGAREFIARLDGRKLVVSGVQHPELGDVLHAHDLATLFADAYGGRKTELLRALVHEKVIDRPAVYYGDTRDDWQAATGAGLDFVLVTCDTEWAWRGEYHGPRTDTFAELALV